MARCMLVLCLTLAPMQALCQEAVTENAPSLVSEATEAVTQVGMPSELSVKGVLTWALYIAIITALGYFGKKYKDRAELQEFFRDADAAVDQVYLDKIEGKQGGKLDGPTLRAAGLEILKATSKPAAKLLKKKGPGWVMAALHRIANRKTKEGADAKAAKQAVAAIDDVA